MNAKDEMRLSMKILTGDFDPDQPRDENGRWTSTGASGFSTSYYGKVGTVKYRDLSFEIDKDGNITSGPKAFMEGLKHPKAPGEGISQGDVVVYAPKFASPGEEKYIHVVLEERGDRCLIGTLNTRLSLGSTETVGREMIQSIGYNAGVSDDWKKYNDPEK